ncbi:nitrogen assimilation transcription factor nirA [Ilyonectria robusta]
MLSIVPPRDALATAQRVLDVESHGRKQPLYYLELNAISPGLSAEVEALFQGNESITLIDGGIIGGPPSPKNDSPTGWKCPSLVTSGPTKLPYEDLVQKLNMKHVSPSIGGASGLKMCFASMTKGFIALAIESFVTADSLGVLPELRQQMEMHNAEGLAIASRGITSMPPKAYRWVYEMQQIAVTMHENGGFNKGMFDEVAEVYRVVAEDTELGLEQSGERNRGTTVEDVVEAMQTGMKNAKQVDKQLSGHLQPSTIVSEAIITIIIFGLHYCPEHYCPDRINRIGSDRSHEILPAKSIGLNWIASMDMS